MLALGLLGNGGGAPATDVGARLDAIQKRYEAVRDLRARFEQTSLVASIGREDVSRGEVLVMRPGRMRWHYTDPEERIIVIDGDTLKLYSPRDKQLQIASIGEGSLSPTALDFLLGTGDLRRDFRAAPLESRGRAEVGLGLEPRQDSGFERLELWVHPQTSELAESVLIDLFGNRTRIRFVDLRENTGVSADSFVVDVPEGTEVIDLRTGPADREPTGVRQ